LVGLRPVARQIAARGRLCAGAGWPGSRSGALWGFRCGSTLARVTPVRRLSDVVMTR